MKIEILLYAQLRERLEADRLTLELPPGADVRTLLEALEGEHPLLADYRDHLLIARGGDYIGLETELAEGDVVALYPPLSGG